MVPSIYKQVINYFNYYQYKIPMNDILNEEQYCTNDPFIVGLLNDMLSKGRILIQMEEGAGKRKGKSANQQNLINLKNSDGKFKYLYEQNEGMDEIDYEEEQNKRKRGVDMQLIEPPLYKLIGYTTDRGSKLKKKPILRMSDLYLSHNPKIKRLMDRLYERYIYGRNSSKRTEEGVMISKQASNANELEEILKNYQAQQQDYALENQQTKLNQQQLEQYIIQRGQSKQNYFLFYKNQQPKTINYSIQNNPINSEQFIKQLHHEVHQIQRQYTKIQEIQDNNEEYQKNKEKKEVQEKEKEYFGQFKPIVRQKVSQKLILEDTFQSKFKSSQALTNNIIEYFSYVDNTIVDQQYLLPQEQNDQLQLNLANPYFFQPKLHTILHRQKQFLQQNQYKARLAQANKNNKLDVSLLSAYSGKAGKSKMLSGSQAHDMNGERQEQHLTIQKVIEAQIKNMYKQPLKHSQIATKYDFVKFTFEEECFNQLHRFNFPFYEHLLPGKSRIQIVVHKNRKAKPNGLVINSQMKESNDKFSRKEDISLVKGEFIMIQYIEENPLLMSDVGMCQRMFVQVNCTEILEKVKAEALHNKSFEEMEEERDVKKSAQIMTYQKNCDLWRKCVKDIFGQNGKQLFWQPKYAGKLIGLPQGPGVALMQSNLCNVPIVKKKPSTREFILVRQRNKWVIRKIQSLYVSGQIEPNKKVFCPGSRTHTEFKAAYEKAFIYKQIKQYGGVNFDQMKLAFKGETQNCLRRILKSVNTQSKDSKLYKATEQMRINENDLTPEQICLYERMQRSLCELRQVGITQIKTNEKMKNVLKQFNRRHYLNQQKITIARMIREQLQLTSWYLTESFLKYKHRQSKIQINGFADPTNGRGGFSYINKPQKQRTSKEDMEDRAEKQRSSALQDLRKLKVDDSKEKLRQMGHNEDEIDFKGRWQLINILKNKEGTEYSRRERETKNKKIQNQKKEINKNFNKLLAYLNDQTEQPAYDYARQKRNKLDDYIKREQAYYQKIKRKFDKSISQNEVIKQQKSDDSDEDD